MIRNEPIIGVSNVRESSEWYQKLLACKSAHGGDEFEMLTDDDDTVILCLHKWGAHEHPTLLKPGKEIGNGLILYFRVDDLDAIWKNAVDLGANLENEPYLNTNSGKQEFAVRDLDGYFILISL